MLNRKLFYTLLNKTNNRHGMVLIVVMGLISLMILSTISLSNSVKQDANLVAAVKYRSQAQYIAEAGINHAIAKLKKQGFASRSNFSEALDIEEVI